MALSSLLHGQEEKIEPKDPILQAAPSRSEWTVKITEKFPDSWADSAEWESQSSSSGSVQPAQEVKKERSVKYEKDADRKTYRLTTKWTTGDSDEEWIVMGQHVAERANGGFYVVGSENLAAQELAKMDFPRISWIERKNYKGIKVYKGRKVFVFEEDYNRKKMTPTEARFYFFARQQDPNATPMEIFKPRFDKVVVYLDVASQLPVLANDGTKLYNYEFKKPSSGRLRPPDKVLAFLRQRYAEMQARTTPPPGPGVKK